LVLVVLFYRLEWRVKLVKTCRPIAAIFVHSLWTKRMVKIGFGLIAAVFLLQFYYVRELVFMEAVVALGFVVVALIGALYALGYIAALWLRRLGSGLKALGAFVSVRHRQPFAETTVTGLSDAKEEVS
jgi:phosphotransferase system  glucose/maltose/N-acetylglucosamine-specific IIC component